MTVHDILLINGTCLCVPCENPHELTDSLEKDAAYGGQTAATASYGRVFG